MSKRSHGGTRKSGTSASKVSSARLHQKSGTRNAFGGYTKVKKGNGTFRMRPTGK
jgi:hypothetical protein